MPGVTKVESTHPPLSPPMPLPSRMEARSAVPMEFKELVLAAMAALGKTGTKSLFVPVTLSPTLFCLDYQAY